MCMGGRGPVAWNRPLMNCRRPFVAIVLLLSASVALGDPPDWAPAHGWRKKHDPYYVGQSGTKWPTDYGVIRGSCDYQTVGAVVGGVTGGAIGAAVGKGDSRAVAILVGTVVGAVVGSRIGRELEEQDRACIGQSLELTHSNRSVSWDNPDTGVQYLLVPKNEYSRNGTICRDFDLHRTLDKRTEITGSSACLSADNRWIVTAR